MEENIFRYPDTNSSRAEIEFLNRKLRDLKIAIIGMGGTGSYILDLIAKTPVKEVHIFDADFFQVHNAFRAPGAADGKQLDAEGGLKKVFYYYSIYSRMHTGIIPHDNYVTADNISELLTFDFIFISVDKNAVRSQITTALSGKGISFIDVGLGVQMLTNSLIASVRVTVSTASKSEHLSNRIGCEDAEENDYGTNIQIADLNCLNAALAVIRWKRLCGFYQDLKEEYNMLYFTATNKLLNEDYTA